MKMPTDKKPIPFILLDNSVLTYGVRVLVEGADISQFEKNPVMLYRHNDFDLPVGRWENIRKEGGQLLADAVFDYEDDDKDVQRLIGKVTRGFVKMASAGLVELQASDDSILQIAGQEGPTIVKCRLREASIVTIGANHNAFRLFDQDGKEIDLSKDAGLKLTDFIVEPKIKKMEKNYLELLNLADGATPDTQYEAISLLLSDKKAAEDRAVKAETDLLGLQTTISKAKTAESLTLVDAAVKDGRIDAAGKDTYLELFDANFEAAKKSLASITPRKSVASQIEMSNNGQTMELADIQKLTWDELDKGGKLLLLKDKAPEVYATKFQERYGHKPE